MKRFENFSKEELWNLRQQICLWSCWEKDYINTYNIDTASLSQFFDGYANYIYELGKEFGDPDEEFEILDNSDELWNYYSCFEDFDIRYDKVSFDFLSIDEKARFFEECEDTEVEFSRFVVEKINNDLKLLEGIHIRKQWISGIGCYPCIGITNRKEFAKSLEVYIESSLFLPFWKGEEHLAKAIVCFGGDDHLLWVSLAAKIGEQIERLVESLHDGEFLTENTELRNILLEEFLAGIDQHPGISGLLR